MFDNPYYESISLYCKQIQKNGNKITCSFPMFQVFEGKYEYLSCTSGEYVLYSVSYECENGEYVTYRIQGDGTFVYQGGTVSDVVECDNSVINYKSNREYTATTPPQIRDIRLLSSREVVKPAVIGDNTSQYDYHAEDGYYFLVNAEFRLCVGCRIM